MATSGMRGGGWGGEDLLRTASSVRRMLEIREGLRERLDESGYREVVVAWQEVVEDRMATRREGRLTAVLALARGREVTAPQVEGLFAAYVEFMERESDG